MGAYVATRPSGARAATTPSAGRVRTWLPFATRRTHSDGKTPNGVISWPAESAHAHRPESSGAARVYPRGHGTPQYDVARAPATSARRTVSCILRVCFLEGSAN